MSEVPTALTNEIKPNKFEGDGVVFKGKLIGMEDVSVDRDEKVCLDVMFKLKAIAQARAEHKQKIQLNLTMTAVRVIDDTTKVQIASHEIERVSFVVLDPRDARAFGYIYNTNNDRHQFWAIKTERPAGTTVLALKELFEVAFERYTNLEKAKAGGNQTTTTSVPTQQTSPGSTSVATSAPPPSQPAQQPTISLIDNILNDNTSSTVPTMTQIPQQQQTSTDNFWDMGVPVASAMQPTTPVIQPISPGVNPFPVRLGSPASTSVTGMDDLFSGFTSAAPPPVTTIQQQPPPAVDMGDLFSGFTSAAPPPVITTQKQPQPAVDMGNLFSGFTPVAPPPVTTTQQQPQPAVDMGDLFSGFTSAAPPPVTTTQQQPQPAVDMGDLFSGFTPVAPPPVTSTNDLLSMLTPATPLPTVSTNVLIQPTQQKQQPNLLGSMPMSPVAPSTVAGSSGQFDLLGDFLSEPTTNKSSYFPPPPPPRPVQ